MCLFLCVTFGVHSFVAAFLSGVIRHRSQEDRRAAQKQASVRFAEFLDEEHVSLGITFRTTWRDARDVIERKAPAETDVLEDNDRRRLVDELVSKLGKVRPPLLPTCFCLFNSLFCFSSCYCFVAGVSVCVLSLLPFFCAVIAVIVVRELRCTAMLLGAHFMGAGLESWQSAPAMARERVRSSRTCVPTASLLRFCLRTVCLEPYLEHVFVRLKMTGRRAKGTSAEGRTG